MNESAPTLHLVLQNVAHGGFRLTGVDQVVDDRWDALTARILSAGQPDIVVLNECANWNIIDDDGEQPYVRRAERDLGLVAAPLSRVHTLQGQPSLILYNPGTVGELVDLDDRHRDQFYHGYAIATWAVPGLAKPLSVAACHLNPYDRDRARSEAAAIATHTYYHGAYAIIAGDFNSCPIEGPDPDIEAMRPYNRANRLDWTTDPATGERIWTPSRKVAQRLLDYEFHDAAVVHHRALARTLFTAAVPETVRAEMAETQARTGKTDRIDWVMVAKELVPCVAGYKRLTEPADASDHAGVRVELTLANAGQADWTYG